MDTSRMYEVLSKDNTPVVNLQRFQKVNSGIVSAVFASSATRTVPSFTDFSTSVNKVTDNRFSLVEGSLFELEGTHVPMYRCMLAHNVESIEYSDSMPGFTCVNANVFSDPDDNLWRLVGTEGQKRLVQVSADNLESILEQKLTRNRVVSNVASDVDYKDGDYVCFMNAVTSQIDFGHVIVGQNTDLVLPRSNSAKPIKIFPYQVLEAAFIPHTSNGKGEAVADSPSVWKRKQTMATEADFNPNAYLDYMRSLYGNTAFYRALENAIKGRGVR